jgi:hypothetical protein
VPQQSPAHRASVTMPSFLAMSIRVQLKPTMPGGIDVVFVWVTPPIVVDVEVALPGIVSVAIDTHSYIVEPSCISNVRGGIPQYLTASSTLAPTQELIASCMV